MVGDVNGKKNKQPTTVKTVHTYKHIFILSIINSCVSVVRTNYGSTILNIYN